MRILLINVSFKVYCNYELPIDTFKYYNLLCFVVMKAPIIGGDKSMELLAPLDDTITIKGNLFYHESGKGWNTLRLKKEVLHEFPDLRDKKNKCIYVMKVYKNPQDLKNEISKIDKKSLFLPIILYLGKERE